jgi:EAL and modified HD-GYP domain-containing signal transduction protein
MGIASEGKGLFPLLPTVTALSDAYLARQPIFDRHLRIFGYEILYRAGPGQAVNPHAEGDKATSNVLIDLFTYHDLERLVGGQRAFVNLTPTFLFDPGMLPLSRDRLVLEVLEDIAVDEEMVEAVRHLSRAGYTLALDDFVLNETTRPLVPLADLIKLDIRALPEDELREQVQELRHHPAKLLAEKVETHSELAFCRQLGFDYFQGFFLSRPRLVKARRLPADRLRILDLLRRLQDPDASLEQLAELIGEDISLSYRLLRLINSAFFPIRHEIESIQRAVVYLGIQGVRTWATWIALSGIKDKPSELKVIALARARMCTLLCDELGGQHCDRWFTVGLFSAADALMDVPLEQALDPLPLSEDLVRALLRHEGTMGRALHAVLAYEQGQWEEADDLEVPPGRLREVYLDSLGWAERADAALHG